MFNIMLGFLLRCVVHINFGVSVAWVVGIEDAITTLSQNVGTG